MQRTLFAALASACLLALPGKVAAEKAAQPGAGPVQTGSATYYSKRFEGRRTASGETFRNDALTAAHPSLPFGTTVMVTCLERGRSVVVRITDRLPSKRAIIDLTQKAAAQLDMLSAGRTRVSVQVLEWGKGGAQALKDAVPAALGAVAATVMPSANAAPAASPASATGDEAR